MAVWTEEGVLDVLRTARVQIAPALWTTTAESPAQTRPTRVRLTHTHAEEIVYICQIITTV